MTASKYIDSAGNLTATTKEEIAEAMAVLAKFKEEQKPSFPEDPEMDVFLEAHDRYMEHKTRVARNTFESNDFEYTSAQFAGAFGLTYITEVQKLATPNTLSILLLSPQLYMELRTDAVFLTTIEPPSNHQLVMDGIVGDIGPTQVITDAFMHQQLRPLPANEGFLFHGHLASMMLAVGTSRNMIYDLIEAMNFAGAKCVVRLTRS